MKTKLLARSIATVVLLIVLCFSNSNIKAQDEKTFEVYGFAMMEAGYNFRTINPNWYDAMRVTRLPSFKNEFAPDGKVFFSARQSQLGVKSFVKTEMGDFRTRFDFDLFGVGGDEGQTTIRLRHAYGELGPVLAGQTNSNFMDGDVFPNQLEYWGPTGMIFFRNIQIRYSPVMTKQNLLAFSLENPGASGDQGAVADRNELTTVKPLFNVPDLTGSYKYMGDWGYVKVAGIVGSLKWRNVSDTATLQLNGSAVRWGGTVSTNINLGKKAVLKLQGVYGEGMENYMNDAPVDVGVMKNTTGDTVSQPFKGVALPVWGITAFVDLNWSKKFTSTAGYSVETIDNSDLQNPIAFKQGQYGLVNLLYYPVDNVMMGVEYNFGRRDNYSDGFHSTTSMVRFAFRYNFSQIWSWK